MNKNKLEKLSKFVRYCILTSTTKAGSGHPTSSLSAVELMVGLMFGGIFKTDLKNHSYHNNDRLIFSKGHASPLFYSLYVAAGVVSEKELKTLRKFNSRLEGHPTMAFPYTEVATGSLGQGLSIGLGMALNAKYLDKLDYRTYVLLGDSEMAEGSVWEAVQLAAHYKLDNLIGILDMSRLGQRGETMYGNNTNAYKKRFDAFGWKTIVADGHSIEQIILAYQKAAKAKGKPVIIIAETIKGKGVSFLEGKNGWHGRTLSEEELKVALSELGDVDFLARGNIARPRKLQVVNSKLFAQGGSASGGKKHKKGQLVSTRKSYGEALVKIFPKFSNMVVLDAEVSNSTYSEIFKNAYPDRFFEMYVAEQNMVGTALGLSCRGKIPFVSTFAAFFTRAFDQIRMSQYSDANIKFVGSHAGVSIGEDGASQMGLGDIAMFRTFLGGTVLYPSDAVSTEKLVRESAGHKGNVYIRTTRKDLPVIYSSSDEFIIGGSKVLRKSSKDVVAVIGAGITLHETLSAYEELLKEKINIRVIDLYSIKPIDKKTLIKAALETKAIITVEDHFAEGGIGEAVKSALAENKAPVYSLAVEKMPKSGKPEQLLDDENISSKSIIKKVKSILRIKK